MGKCVSHNLYSNTESTWCQLVFVHLHVPKGTFINKNFKFNNAVDTVELSYSKPSTKFSEKNPFDRRRCTVCFLCKLYVCSAAVLQKPETFIVSAKNFNVAAWNWHFLLVPIWIQMESVKQIYFRYPII